jgi:glycerol-1-phosphate dehydrogenase [NAD(P)+]
MAPAVGALQPEGIAYLTRQVLLAGLAQSVVNLSAPLSGTEHVVSHLLDMGAGAWERRPALHGAQVGVATLLAAQAYELLFERFDPARPRPRPPVPEAVQAAIGAAFAALDPSGRMAAECWRHYSEKLARWVASEGRFDSVRARWGTEIAPRLRRLVRPPATVREILRRAGHPLRFEDLRPPIPRWQVAFALAHAHLIRDRFTVGDLFVFLGTPADGLAEELSAE